MSSPKQAPIGIFDSGIGGLTVVKSVMNLLPNEHIIYFGDTARVPYGIKSTETIRQYALQITDFLLKKNVKMILIACNSVAAAASSEIKKKSRHIPVLDVIEAGTLAALSHSKSTRPGIGVIGTLATIGSGAYEEALHRQNTDIQVFSRACPLLVPLAEEGWTDNSIALDVLGTYLKDFQSKNLDAMILGCTHYPLFKKGISQILGEKIKIVDSAESIAVLAREHLEKAEQLHNGTEGSFHCYVSDKPQRFKLLAERFLGKKLNRVEIVNLKG
ncbi:glutamate racemase [Natronogracilivirga saccharolytica]|uniref:Glutamate racemase n=1 Tax=Natronogracilivirga saccharolytica TaxID=2812953 RepID=A0A8J7RIN0_9BACT|nr:glutamate racemase [Natronogracilivirga saccharolytica]MBP3191325.1 glutamate racemase [Natronogracilivirga saccharolytica]